MNRNEAEQLDQHDLLASYRDHFNLPNGAIYLCGHSLGAMLKQTSMHVANMMNEQWGQEAICAWDKSGWINISERIGGKLAKMIGANSDEVIVADSTSVNLFKLLASGLKLRPERNIILTDIDNFPTDLYMAQAVADLHSNVNVVRCHRSDIQKYLNEKTAILMLTHVNYRSSELYDLKAMTELAHSAGALTLYDLSHSVGVIPLALNECHADMAVGCGYKYLNGGPGAPAFMFVAKRHQDKITSPLTGWMGHESPFDFANEYVPAAGIRRFLCGTPPILSMGALESSIDFLENISMSEMRTKSQRLGNYLIKLIAEKCPTIEIVTSLNSQVRGSHVAFTHPHAFAIKQALLVEDVISDYRAPNLLRFGLSPLYVRYVDIYDAVMTLAKIVSKKSYFHADIIQKLIVT